MKNTNPTRDPRDFDFATEGQPNVPVVEAVPIPYEPQQQQQQWQQQQWQQQQQQFQQQQWQHQQQQQQQQQFQHQHQHPSHQGFPPQQGYAPYPAVYAQAAPTAICRSCGRHFQRQPGVTENMGGFYKCKPCCDQFAEVGIVNSCSIS